MREAPPTLGASLGLLVFGYSRLWTRVFRDRVKTHGDTRGSALYATSCTVGKLAQMQGVIRYTWTRLVLGRDSHLIEYK